MRCLKLCFAVNLAFLCCGNLTAQNQKKETTKPLRGLLISGGCCHDYPNQDLIITQGISQRANVTWEVYRGGTERTRKPAIYQTEDWSNGFDVVVHNECYGHISDIDFVDRIVKGHTKNGIPMVVIHCSMHSYRNAKTDEWRKLLGVTSKRHERGGRQLDVVNRATDHPIMKMFPATWRTPNGELYVIESTWPEFKPLATSFGLDTKQDQPVIWTNQVGKVKVFGTTLGHHNETMMSDPWLDVVSRGLLWTCDKLQEDGTPAEGYKGTGKAPIKLLGKPVVSTDQPTLASWASSVEFPKTETAVKLFNGRDLSGWRGQAEYFSVDESSIIARNSVENAPRASTYLMTKNSYQNFRLVFEGKLLTSRMHSGISFWGQAIEKEADPFSYQGHLVMFPGNWGFWDLYRRNSIYADDGRAKKVDRIGDWNKIEILAIDARIQVAVNGVKVADWTDPKPELCQNAPIGLQLHSNKVAQEVRFRGLILSENPQDRLITIK